MPDSRALPWQSPRKFISGSEWNSLALGETPHYLYFRKPSGTLGDTWTHQDPRSCKLGARRTSLKGGEDALAEPSAPPLLHPPCSKDSGQQEGVLVQRALPSSREEQRDKKKSFSFLPLNRSQTRLKHKS